MLSMISTDRLLTFHIQYVFVLQQLIRFKADYHCYCVVRLVRRDHEIYIYELLIGLVEFTNFISLTTFDGWNECHSYRLSMTDNHRTHFVRANAS